MAKRQLVITGPAPSDPDEAPTLGSRREVLATLSKFNTWPDVEGGEFLYGPGLTMQMTPGAEELSQMLVAVLDEDIAWTVLTRICKTTHWQLLDLESGRSLSFS